MTTIRKRQAAVSGARRQRRTLGQALFRSSWLSVIGFLCLGQALHGAVAHSGTPPRSEGAAVLGTGGGKLEPAVARLVAEMMTPEPEVRPAAVWPGGSLFAPQAAQDRREDAAGALWSRFRTAHPVGFQGIAVSDLRGDGSCSIVLSEPPPHVTLAQITELIPDASVMRQANGHQGWLFDVVGNLDGGELEVWRKLRVLHHLLFRSEHGAFVYREPFARPWHDAGRFSLDLGVRASELHRWVHAPEARFVAVEGGKGIPRSSLVSSASCGVYRLPEQSLVGWWLPRGVPVSDCLTDARIFALESDLILGAIQQVSGLLILARERVAPYELIPPLRGETLALLASVAVKGELAQSYQRLHPGAGRYNEAWDWAPILLSPELVNTEYGDLLNVADQLLKGWSEHGDVKYQNFRYAPPLNWAFPEALSNIVYKQTKQARLTFNWNTTGLGYAVPMGEVAVYALSRTGALPVSYIPGEDPKLAPAVAAHEDTAYNWYAAMQNPTLVRVVQYAALYQIFHLFKRDADAQSAPLGLRPAQGFAAAMAPFLRTANQVSPRDLDKRIGTPVLLERIKQSILDRDQAMRSRLSAEQQAQYDAWLDRELKKEALTIRERLRTAHKAWQGLDPGTRQLLQRDGIKLDMAVHQPAARAALSQASDYLEALAAHEGIAARYVSQVAPTGESWIHTPVVVMSRSAGAGDIGGHNLRAGVTRIETSAEVGRSQVTVKDDALVVHPENVDRAAAILRRAARGLMVRQDPQRLGAELTLALGKTPRPAQRSGRAVLGAPAGRSALSASTSVRMLEPARLALPREVVSAWRDATEERVRTVKHGGMYWVMGPDRLPPVRTQNLGQASELTALRIQASRAGRSARRARRPAGLDMIGFSPAENQTMLRGLQAQAQRRGFAQDVAAQVRQETGFSRTLNRQNYDFSKIRVEVGKLERQGEEVHAEVRAEIPARKPGLRAALVRFWVSFTKSVRESEIGQILSAVNHRLYALFGSAERNELPESSDPATLLHQEIRHLGPKHGVRVQTQVIDAAGDWWQVQAPHPQRRGLPKDDGIPSGLARSQVKAAA